VGRQSFKKYLFIQREKRTSPCPSSGYSKIKRIAGQGLANGYTFERCNTYIVEVLSKDPDYIYSKRVWYIDPETYIIHWQEIYDELGRYWKCFMQPTQDFKTEGGETKILWRRTYSRTFSAPIPATPPSQQRKSGKKLAPSYST